MAKLGRIPISPLDYKDKHLAKPKELVINYETGDIYIASPTGELIDVTSEIKNAIDNIGGDKIEITIPGLGTINLTEYLIQIKTAIDNSLQVVDSNRTMHYIPKASKLDGSSIESKYSFIQIVGFDTARELTVPQKKNGSIVWTDLPIAGDNPDGSGGGIPDNEDSTKSTRVEKIEPVNGRVNLKAIKRQMTTNMHENATIILPKTLDEFCEIYWHIITYSFKPEFKFGENILFRNNRGVQPAANSHQIYKFITWDAGNTWMAEYSAYGEIGTGSEEQVEVDVAYLEQNYVSKQELATEYYDVNEMKDLYFDKIDIRDGYYSVEDIIRSYYSKQEIDTLLAWKQ